MESILTFYTIYTNKMPAYTCDKCFKEFPRKSGYDSHMSRKTPCKPTKTVEKVIEEKAIEIAKTLSEDVIVLPENEDQRRLVLQKFFEDLHNLLWSNAGLSPEKALDHMTFFFAYRLLENQADTLGLPNVCRWSHVASIKDEHDLFDKIKKGYVEFKKNPITTHFFKQPEISKAMVVYNIVKLINKLPLKAIQESDTLGSIFEYMLGRGMSTMSDEGQYFTNRKICELAFELAYSIKETIRRPDGSLNTFADWFCGTGGFPAEFVKGISHKATEAGDVIDWSVDSKSIYCQDMNLSSVSTTLLNMLILTGSLFSSANIRSGNSFTDQLTIGSAAPFKDVTIDYCFMNPPYGGDKTKGKEHRFAYAKGKGSSKIYQVNQEIQRIGIEDDDKVSAGVQLAMATLSEDGVCSIVLPQGFFFGASKKAVELRKKITEEYKIHYVVDIVSGAFVNTGTKTSMIVFQKGGVTDSVKFMDMDEKVLVEASLEDLQKKNYSLNYKQYLAQEAVEVDGFEMVKLGDVCQLISGYAFKSESFTTNTSDMRVLKIKNIKNETVVFDESDDRYTYTDKLEKFIVKENEFVVAMTGATTGKVGIHTSKEKVLLNQRVGKFCNFKNTVLPQYVFYYIKNKPNLFMDLAAGTARENISPEQILSVQIPLPSLERQQQIVEAIDGWTVLAQQEEQALKTLEKQVMFQVKEMGRGKERVKLGSIATFTFGYGIKSEDFGESGLPIIKTKNFKDGGVSIISSNPRSDKNYDDKYLIKKGDLLMVVDGACGESALWLDNENAWLNQHVAKLSIENQTTRMYIAFVMKGDDFKEYIQSNVVITTIPHMQRDVAKNFEIPLPPLAEQQTLQSDFDEIRHKHAKIAYYKAKAADAIKRLIPGAE